MKQKQQLKWVYNTYSVKIKDVVPLLKTNNFAAQYGQSVKREIQPLVL
jgi:hypothetical protein